MNVYELVEGHYSVCNTSNVFIRLLTLVDYRFTGFMHNLMHTNKNSTFSLIEEKKRVALDLKSNFFFIQMRILIIQNVVHKDV